MSGINPLLACKKAVFTSEDLWNGLNGRIEGLIRDWVRWQNNPLKCVLKKVGITEFRWHDLRHTWASRHVQSGTPLHVLQELGAWESVEMVRKYAHLSSDHLTQYVDRRFSTIQAGEGVVMTNLLRSVK